jgi:type IV pilus assembly protein PilW
MKSRRHARGLTLVELLVSISIGLVVVGALAALYLNTARSYRQLEALGQLQSNARYVFELMGYDIRMAGNMTCQVPGQANPTNFFNNYRNNWWSNTDRTLFGQDETTDSNAVGDANFPQTAPGGYGPNALRGDTLVVLRANADDTAPGVVASYSTGSTNPIALSSGSFNVGSLLLLTDCQTTASLFQMTGNTGGIQHSTALAVGSSQDMAGAKLLPLSANAYYLRNSGRKYRNSSSFIPSLYRQTLTTSSGSVATEGQELVSGVTDLQILYGVDTSTSPTGVIGSYMTANQIKAAGYDWSDPKRVLAVRVTVMLESQDDNVSTESSSFTLGNGTVITDRRLRRSYTMTFGLRKRLS